MSTASTQQLVQFLITRIGSIITTPTPPANWQAVYDTEAPIQSTFSYAVMTIIQNPPVGFFNGKNYDLRYVVKIYTPRKNGAAVGRNINDLLTADGTGMHNTNLPGFVSATTDCIDMGGACVIEQDSYTVQSIWRVFGDPTLS